MRWTLFALFLQCTGCVPTPSVGSQAMSIDITEPDTDVDERAEIMYAITEHNAHAKRQPYVVARMMCDKPTSWDNAHAHLNALLTMLEATA